MNLWVWTKPITGFSVTKSVLHLVSTLSIPSRHPDSVRLAPIGVDSNLQIYISAGHLSVEGLSIRQLDRTSTISRHWTSLLLNTITPQNAPRAANDAIMANSHFVSFSGFEELRWSQSRRIFNRIVSRVAASVGISVFFKSILRAFAFLKEARARSGRIGKESPSQPFKLRISLRNSL